MYHNRLSVTKAPSETSNVASSSDPPPTGPWLPPVDISHLSPEQQQLVEEVPYEEAFAQNSGDIGCVPSLQIEIRLKEDTPVQKAYASKIFILIWGQ